MNSTPVSTSAGEAAAQSEKHIVDVLIEERAENLMLSPLWPLYKAILYPMLLYGPAVKMADAVATLSASGAFDYVSNLLHIDVIAHGVENIPAQGRVLIAATHPTGIPDGVAMYDAIKGRRPDMTFFANRDAMRAVPGIEDMIIPVEWVEAKRTRQRTRETLTSTVHAFQSEKCIVLFPSGRIAFMGDNKRLVEQEWLPTVAAFARKYNCTVVPAHMEARNSWLYYWFWKLNAELRDITLFHELLNKKGKTYKLTFGEAITPDQLKGDANDVAAALREHAMGLGDGGEKKWQALQQRQT